MSVYGYRESEGDVKISKEYKGMPVVRIGGACLYFRLDANGNVTTFLSDDNVGSFEGCTEVSSVNIEASIVVMPENVFNRCTALKTVYLPETLKIIDKNAFNGCESLENVYVGKSLYQIGEGAFIGCDNLKMFYCKSLKPAVGPTCFDVFSKKILATLYVPKGTELDYLGSETWYGFNVVGSDFIEIMGKVKVPESDSRTFVYNGNELTYGIEETELYTVSGNKQTNAGNYTVVVSLKDKDNTKWKDGSTEDKEYRFVIEKSEDVVYPVGFDPSNLKLKAMYGQTLEDVVLPKGYEWKNPRVSVGKVGVNEFVAVFTPDDTDNYVPVETMLEVSVGKAKVDMPDADKTKFVYNGETQTYSITNSELYEIEGVKQTKAGRYEVLVSLVDTKNYMWNDGTSGDLSYSFVIAKAEVKIPDVDKTKFVHNGVVQTYGIAKSELYEIVGAKQTKAGKYDVIVSLADTKNYIWDDGTSDDLEYLFVINKAQIEKPDADNSEFVYDGEKKIYKINENEAYTVSGNIQTEVGKYKVAVSLNDIKNYEWSDGSTDDLEYSFVIRESEPVVTLVDIPVVTTKKFVYNGKTQSLDIEENDAYYVNGNTATNVGRYTATISLVDSKNTTWSDGTTDDITIAYTISKVKVDIPDTDETKFVANGKVLTYDIEESELYAIEGNKQSKAGKYEVVVSLNDKRNYEWSDGTTDDLTYDFIIEKAPVEIIKVEAPVVESNSFVYNGKKQSLAIEESEFYTIEGNSGKNAGKYTVTVSLVDAKTTTWTDGTTDDIEIPFVIAKAKVDMPAADDTKFVVNGKVLTYGIEESELYAIEGNKQSKAGKYEVVVSLNDKKNYEWSDGTTDDLTYDFIIEKAPVEIIKVEAPVVESNSFVYNGKKQSLAIEESDYYTITGNSGKNVGKYIVTVSLVNTKTTTWEDGTTDDLIYTFTITKAKVSIPDADDTKFVANGKVLTYDIEESELYAIEGSKQSKAGKYEVVVSLNDKKNYEWSDGTTDDLTYDFIIEKAPVELIKVEAPVVESNSFVYNGKKQSLAIEENDYYTITGNLGKNVGKYTVAVSLVDTKITAWEDGTTDDLIYTFTITKAKVAIPDADDTKFVANGKILTYNIEESEFYAIEGSKQSKAGKYEVVVSLNDKKNYEWSDGTTDDLTFDFVIGKKDDSNEEPEMPDDPEKPIVPITADDIMNPSVSDGSITAGDKVNLYKGDGEFVYNIKFDDKAKDAGFKDLISVNGDGGISFNIPEGTKPGRYTATVEVRNEDGSVVTKEITFYVDYPEYYIKQIMSDILTVDNSDNEFVSYQWYKNGVKIDGATKQFFCDLEGIGGKYKVEITNTDGEVLYIAETEFATVVPAFNFTISKNPVNVGEEFVISIVGVDENTLASSGVFVYDSFGKYVSMIQNISRQNTLTINNTGTYIIVVRIAGGMTSSKGIIVK